jgi:hypothetical protein
MLYGIEVLKKHLEELQNYNDSPRIHREIKETKDCIKILTIELNERLKVEKRSF